ncbi:hypothetical protein EQH57_0190 [Dictyocoela roeselum]|nr:hypothetical protein EQH57_0190 [Dictyocoela roeselum]
MLIEEFDYEIRYIQGNKNLEADLLSRNLVINSIKINNVPTVKEKELKKNSNDNPPKTTKHSSEFKNIYTTLIDLHTQLGHPGFHTFSKTLANYIDIQPHKPIIKKMCSSCLKCNQEKTFTHKYCHTNWTTKLPELRETLCVDIKGPIKASHYNTNNRITSFYILLMTDWLSRFNEVKILYDITSKSIINSIHRKWFLKHGIPKNLLTDNGRQFISKTFEKFTQDHKINHVFSGAYNPTGNSVVERRNLEVGLILRLNREASLKKLENAIWDRLNLCYNRVIRHSPAEVFLNLPTFENLKPFNKIKPKNLKKRIRSSISKNLNYKNRKRIFKKYSVGEMIFVKNFSNDKVDTKWFGPFEVMGYSKGENNVIIKKINKTVKVPVKITRPCRGEVNVVHAHHLNLHGLPELKITKIMFGENDQKLGNFWKWRKNKN